jgi:hypothetical protein
MFTVVAATVGGAGERDIAAALSVVDQEETAGRVLCDRGPDSWSVTSVSIGGASAATASDDAMAGGEGAVSRRATALS